MDDDEDNPGGGDRNDRPEAPAGDREEQAAEGQRPAASAAFKAHVARHRALMAEWYALLLRRADGPLPAAEEYRYWDLIAEGLHSMAGDMPVTVEGQLQNYAALAIKAAIAGFPPKAWLPASRGGRAGGRRRGRRMSVVELKAIRTCVAYARAVEEGLVVDDDWRNYLVETFGISTDTLDRWLRADPGAAHANLCGALRMLTADPPDRLDEARRLFARRLVEMAASQRQHGI